jgi:hypothetical protein
VLGAGQVRGSLALVPPIAERGDSVDQEFVLEYLVDATTDVEAVSVFLRHIGNTYIADLKKSSKARGIIVEDIKVRSVGVEANLTEGVSLSLKRVVTVSYRLSLEIDHSYEMKALLLFGEVHNDLAMNLHNGSYGSAKVSFSSESESDIIPVSRV